jgi:hypothetical protein
MRSVRAKTEAVDPMASWMDVQRSPTSNDAALTKFTAHGGRKG